MPEFGATIRFEANFDAMATTFSLVLYGDRQDRMEQAASAAFDEVSRLDRLLSTYRPTSIWSEINRLAAHRPVPLSPEVFHLISQCLQYHQDSQGTFDITVGPLLKTWGFFKGPAQLPSLQDVTAALSKTGSSHIRLDPAGRTIRFNLEGLEINPGGIGKGYAVDRMVDVLRQRGILIALVAGSDSSIYGMGAPPGEPRGWRVNIKDPRTPRLTAAEVYLKDMSLSTSGTAEKFFRAEGRTYAHIMDPRTGYPAQGALAVSILSPRTIDSEAWAKPYFVNGRQWTARHKPADFRVFFCEDKPAQPCAWLP